MRPNKLNEILYDDKIDEEIFGRNGAGHADYTNVIGVSFASMSEVVLNINDLLHLEMENIF